jgi:copper homeostasis protein
MPSSEKIILEICAYSVEAAIMAQSAGADRVELCANRSEAGTTPTWQDIAFARKELNVALHVMIRPRGGDFLYSDAEFAVMKKDIENCHRLGVDGVVLGILLRNSGVDNMRCSELVEFARPMEVTLHRAFDVTTDPHQALEDVMQIGFARVLTSGQADQATGGADLIAQLVRQAGERITVMPGGGIRAENLAELINITGAREFHSAAYTADMPDPNQILKMREIADRLS